MVDVMSAMIKESKRRSIGAHNEAAEESTALEIAEESYKEIFRKD